MNIKTPMGGLANGGLTFDKAMELHRLHHEFCMSYSQIARQTGLNPAMVIGVLNGRYFPGAAKQWEKKA
jgi:hypothetical protein